MKVSYININSNILLGKEKDNVLEMLAKKLLDLGITFNRTIYSHLAPEQIKDALDYAQDPFVFIIGDKIGVKNAKIKSIISRYFGLSFTISQEATRLVNNFYTKNNIEIQVDSQNEYYAPSNSQLLYSDKIPELGFMFSMGKTYIYLPNNIYAIADIFDRFISPIISKDSRTGFQTVSLKTFGISEKDILLQLQDLTNNKNKILITTYPDNLDIKICIRYYKTLDKSIVQSFISTICDRLKKYIYSNEDVSIYQMALDLLKIPNKKIHIAESITNGNIINNLLSVSTEVPNFLANGIVCTNVDSAVKNLNINKSTLNQNGFSSVKVAYEMATNLLANKTDDLVLCTCGELQNFSEMATQVTCYIAVGDADGIHVYKNTYSGEPKSIIENISKSAIYYLIKKLKQNGLFLGQITV